MKKTANDWITEIAFSIANLKEKNRNTYYAFSLPISKKTAEEIKIYFKKENYNVEITPCKRKLYDIIITW